MDNKRHTEAVIKNEETLVRRAWINSAVESARIRINEPLPQAESGSLMQKADEEPNLMAERPARGKRPELYIAWSDGIRRSGT
ncbi:MAG: hypothetical protein GY727_06925 [Gammaproteobacteria bacterium]|nr:hypothetical protein [Gammaproteobacteria bacterium]MCP4091603.1 hypothetical protein [Gammaproteobacteria bacterium]MCP4276099.1 hypothetical protein [Gammaproteobacteria bacterium]MCP4830843.1 hypothetical protein [Gammaproteobacteria bacterium]MCP4929669.1 hypothetical protein [Gammaproteobacteria bacterium]